jgi:dihydroxy-acid dehydratase
VKSGDLIELDVEKKALNLKISESEIKARQKAWKRPPIKYERSYGAIFSRHVKQANEGCDFDFLEGTAPTADPEIH